MKDKKNKEFIHEGISNNENTKDKTVKSTDQKTLPGYPPYPPDEDIFKKDKEESEIDPENPKKTKPAGKKNKPNEKDFEDDKSGNDLDVPGSELDDESEDAGSEDEENNYYSLGGDNHKDLEEDKGDW